MTNPRGGSWSNYAGPRGRTACRMVPGQGDKMLYAGRGAPRMVTMKVETWVVPPNRVVICSGANSERGLSLLASFRIRRCTPLIARLDWQGSLFLDLASALLWGGERWGSGELSEENSSSAVWSLWSGRMGSFPLFSRARVTFWAAPWGLSGLLDSKRVCKRSFSYCKRSACSSN